MANKAVQHLMQAVPRGQPLDNDMLRDLGIGSVQASYMVKAGWLQRLSRGAYLLVGDHPSRDGIIAFLANRIPCLHVGGKTALDWYGVRHNIAFRQRVVLWGCSPYDFPSWVSKHMLFSYQTTQLFDNSFLPMQGLKSLPNGSPYVLVSVPERALLELASDIGKGQTLEEARNIVVTLRNIRPTVLDQFLSHCKRVKVVRLVRDLGLWSGYPWGQDLQKHVDRLGSGKRWSNRTRDGERLTLKP
ncbi:type IV toxin-antitoxin system AbiEi family antitoxin domain-containing protein [Chromobacterium aquaticum]|uniref:Type IV toxin-antitoxin system AbiEi family antitoxin domain-containing protein n=1 Tax=Chromobacterium aquaticum TaxID=467180 RepID=A0ABV8ZNS6_9NEIS|nr:type IV toxin-antitoxin system AbiEi family antitoxin domain-containing protein [Chromobacterium aquaticum]MCD5361260.1 type IV toxin-antitoxin system AbiEi family antitoxin [Chromobacterium aquaticum]